MSDLTDEDITLLCAECLSVGGERGDRIRAALVELKRLRSAHAADEERVRIVVREALRGATSLALAGAPDGLEQLDILATRAAKRLASATVLLAPEEIAQLRHHIADHKATCAYSCSLIERLLDRVASVAVMLTAEERDDIDALLSSLSEQREAAIGFGQFASADMFRDQHAALSKMLATVRP